MKSPHRSLLLLTNEVSVARKGLCYDYETSYFSHPTLNVYNILRNRRIPKEMGGKEKEEKHFV